MAFFRIYVILFVPFSLILVYREFYFSHTSRRTRFSSMEIIRTAADGSRSPSCCFFSAALRIIRYSFADRSFHSMLTWLRQDPIFRGPYKLDLAANSCTMNSACSILLFYFGYQKDFYDQKCKTNDTGIWLPRCNKYCDREY